MKKSRAAFELSRTMRLALALSVLVSSCIPVRPTEVPMPMIFHPAPIEADTLVVLLPGIEDDPEDYVLHGFVERIQATRPTCDVIAADAHFGYYLDRTLLPRLEADVIGPLASSYERVWLVGISMGGFGSAIYAEEHPGTIDGLILLAPFMGDRAAIEPVVSAGGLVHWTPPEDLDAIRDDAARKFNEMWAWYRGYTREPESMPALFIGWGTDDALHVPNRMVAAVLPDEHSLSLPGGHDWSVWEPLFAELVTRALAAR